MRCFLLFVVLVSLLSLCSATIPSYKCAGGAGEISDCRPVMSPQCMACNYDKGQCAGVYTVGSGDGSRAFDAVACGTSTLTSVSNATQQRATAFCCPNGKMLNQTYFCSQRLSTDVYGQSYSPDITGTWSGDYYECSTQSGKDLIDAITSGLGGLVIFLIVGAVAVCLSIASSIVWCCCLGAWCRSHGYYSRGLPMASAVMITSPPVQSPQGSYQAPQYHNSQQQPGFAQQPQRFGQPQTGFQRFA